MKFDIMIIIAVVLALILFGNIALYGADLGAVNSAIIILTGILLLGLSVWVLIKSKDKQEIKIQ